MVFGTTLEFKNTIALIKKEPFLENTYNKTGHD
jgi:hypothetical protein